MIAFGELRRLSVQWQLDLAAVERVYALDWLLKGIFDRAVLNSTLALRGASALGKAYLADYPPVQDADLAIYNDLDQAALEQELIEAARAAGESSGLKFTLHSMVSTEARFEYTGPLGRRSAAQPIIPLRFTRVLSRTEPVPRPLLHPFTDQCSATVRAVALEELAAERIAALGGKPRARDVFDLWFILTHADQLNRGKTRTIAQEIALSKRAELRSTLDRTYRPLLERAWENALRGVRGHPPFSQAETEIHAAVTEIIGI